jgi:putative ABC transport system ATP-binding protein
MTAPLLAFERVCFCYPEAAAAVLSDLSFAVAGGGFMGIFGPSGTGKSSLLRLACYLEIPQSGTIRFDGRPVQQYAPEQLRRQVALVPQVPVMVPGSVRENLLLPFAFKANSHLEPPEDPALVAALAECQLDHLSLGQEASKLSVGQRQRLTILRAMLLEPKVLLLDEPTSALDSENAQRVLDMLTRLNQQQGVTVLMVTHRDADLAFFTDTLRLEKSS